MMRITVTKVARSFVRPSEPTPYETRSLSAIDRMRPRKMVRSLHVFEHGQQTAKVIREALSKTLVLYYPLAGRFVISDHGEDMIECNGEGAWFVEAITNCSLKDVKYLDHVPSMIPENDLLPDPCPKAEPLDVPIMMQVTEFRCSGFVVGFIFDHRIADGIGAAQFKKAIGDFACGNVVPTVNPIWFRHLIPNPPKLNLGSLIKHFPSFKLHSFTFDLPIDYITRIKSAYLQKTNHYCTTFEISTAIVWQARTRAINIDDPDTPTHVCFAANIRHLLTPQVLPQEGGYYGNCIYLVTITASSGSIVSAELVDIVMRIRDGKEKLPCEFARWSNGELKDYSCKLPVTYNTIFVTDWSNLGFSEVDYGWGKPVNVIPLVDFDLTTILGKPLVPKRGSRMVSRCVKEEHMSAFKEHMNGLVCELVEDVLQS